ncbi:MAG TPA: heme biosynthesis HemY N-terminal domain-containing protein, partial [Methylibium sp.]|nr:heme biosynthesis HemY N-terminal domain-containing protein [Methylibium sp.]
MRAVIWLLLLAIVAVVGATLLGDNDNLVTFYWAPWRLDVSFNLFIVGLILFCLLLNALLNAANTLVGLPRRAREWRVSRRDRIAQAALREALSQYFGGRYSRAHKAAQRAVAIQADTPELKRDAEFTVLGHLLSAGSLHRLQDRTRRDEQLGRALELSHRHIAARPAEEGARLLAAEWALDDRDAARTLELLGELPAGVARRTQALRLKLQAARLASEPMEALRTARLLAKHQGFSPAAAQGLIRSLAIDALDRARDADQLRRVWRELDAADRRDVHVAAHAARALAALGGADDARAWLKPFWDRVALLPREDRDAAALALADAADGLGADWLARIEGALQVCPGEGALAYAAGRAFIASRLWGKARQSLEQAAQDPGLVATARREAWLELALLAQRDGDEARTSA